MSHSTGMKFEMEQDKQQNDPQLDLVKRYIGRLEHENNQLRAQVNKLRDDKDAIHCVLEGVHDVYEDATSELQSTRQELVIKCEEWERMQMDLRAKDELISQQETMLASATHVQTNVLPSSASIRAFGSPPSVQESSLDDTGKIIEALKASHATELDKSRRLAKFFKSNSEQVGREVRKLRVTNKALMESVEAKDREIADQLSHINAIGDLWRPKIEELRTSCLI